MINGLKCQARAFKDYLKEGQMSKKLFLISLIILVASGMIFAGCAKTASPANLATGDVKEISLGAVLPLTGNLASLGQGGQFGSQAAVDDINAQGGIFIQQLNRKLPVKLTVLDDQSDSNKSGTLTESLILQNKVNFFIGAGLSPQGTAAVATTVQKYKTPTVCYIGPYEPYMAMRSAVNPPWNYVWALGFHIAAPFSPKDFRNNKAGYTIMDVVSAPIKQFAPQTNKRTAIAASDEPDGRGWYTSFPQALKAMGLDVLGADKELGLAPPNVNDFSTIINQWKAYNCDLLITNALAPWFGTLWKQSKEMGFKPKFVYAGRSGGFYADVNSWGGDLPLGLGAEVTWNPSIKDYKGIGSTTPQSLNDRWMKASGQPQNYVIGNGYTAAQVLFDAISRAGSLDSDKVMAALAQTDVMTIENRMQFDADQFSGGPLAYAQWFKTDTSAKWDQKIVSSQLDFWPVQEKPIFPIP